jgi:hypothetical protein
MFAPKISEGHPATSRCGIIAQFRGPPSYRQGVLLGSIAVATLSAEALGVEEATVTLSSKTLEESAQVEAEIDRIEAQSLERRVAPITRSSVFNPPERAWLAQSFGVQFATVTQFAAMIRAELRPALGSTSLPRRLADWHAAERTLRPITSCSTSGRIHSWRTSSERA